MSRRMIFTTLALVASITARSGAAQGTVTGQWMFEYNRRVSNINGELTESDPVRVRLTLEQRGDSVTGSWLQVSPVDDPMPKSRSLRGLAANGTVRLVSEPSEGRIQDGGGERKVSMTTSLEFSVSGDELVGTRRVTSSEGEMVGDGRPFKAVREKR